MRLDRVRRLRLAAQHLTPETAAADACEAARTVLGIQAQDVRASGLALRSRVPGLERAAIDADSGLVRSWTMRGTVHLHDADDLPWLTRLTGPVNRRMYGGLMEKRGNIAAVRAMRSDIAELLAAGPLTRAELIARLYGRGHPELDQSSLNVLMPWLSAEGLVAGLPDGRFRAADKLPEVDEDEALATLGRRFPEGYAPATADDLAYWSGLPLSLARRALDAAGEPDEPGDPPPAPSVLLLASFDTLMLGWRSREPFVATEHAKRVLPGGGMLRPVVLSRGVAVGNWKVAGSGKKRKLELDSFGKPPARRALAVEAADVARFLGVAL